jgi:HEAT repeat protein
MFKVIVRAAVFLFYWSVILAGSALPQSNPIDKKVDSLFVIASSPEAKFQPLVQPAIDSIAAMGVDVVPRLVGKFDTKSPRERNAITNIFKKIGVPSVAYLVKSLKLDNGLIVERIAGALGEIADSSATIGLLGVATHPRWQVREQTIGSLGRIGDHRGDSAVLIAMSDSIPLVRKSAAVSCGQLKIQSGISPLVHMLGDSFYGARMCAAASILKLDTSKVVASIVDSLNSANTLLGNLGCEVLGQLSIDASINALAEQAFSGSTDRRAHAAIALVQVDPTDKYHLRYFYLATENAPLNRMKVESAIEALSPRP